MKYFDENLIALIDLLEYEMFVITADNHINCPCQSYETKQGDPKCPHCFGTGKKCKIKRIKGVRQPGQQGSGEVSVNVENGIYFFKQDYHLKENDLLIWHNEIEQITKVERHCSDAQKPVYFRCESKKKKADTEVLLKNLYKVIGRKYERRG